MAEKAYNIRNEDMIVGMKSYSLSCFGILGKGLESGVKKQLENSFGTLQNYNAGNWKNIDIGSSELQVKHVCLEHRICVRSG